MNVDYHFMLSIFHILIIVPFFLYIGFQRATTPAWLYTSTLVIGFIIILYHGFKLGVRMAKNSDFAWVNAIHVLLVGPLLVYIGWHKQNTPRMAYELLLMLGFSAAGYHLFSLIRFLDMWPNGV
jgi:hypothetical protein